MSSSLKVPGQPGAYSNADSPSASDASLHRIKNESGYNTPVFKEKDEQRAQVQANVAAKGFIPAPLVPNEVNWFYSSLGIDDTYFSSTSVEIISDHIIALFGAKVLAYTKHDPAKLVIDLEKVDDQGATFIHTSAPGKTSTDGPGSTCEDRYVIPYVTSLPWLTRMTGSTSSTLTRRRPKTRSVWRLSDPPAPSPPPLPNSCAATL